MSAVAERTAPARSQPTPRHAIAATAVEPLEHPAQAAAYWGRHIMQTHCGLFGHVIEAGDVISVDFDARRITCDADYLIAFNYGQPDQWFGVRRFQSLLNGSLQIAEPDDWANAETLLKWRPCTTAILNSITVFGRVLEVFKPVSKTRYRHG